VEVIILTVNHTVKCILMKELAVTVLINTLSFWERGSLFVFESTTIVPGTFLQQGEMKLHIRQNVFYYNSKKVLEFVLLEAVPLTVFKCQVDEATCNVLKCVQGGRHKASTDFQLHFL